MKTHIAVHGACGRMGQRIVQLAHEDAGVHLAAAIDSPNHPQQGKDIGELCGLGHLGVKVSAGIPTAAKVEAVIDFSVPEATMAILKNCVTSKTPLVVATTGFSAEEKKEVEAAAHHTAILCAPNLSLVVNVLYKLVRQAAAALKDNGFDAEIIERHHRFKKDSPSGTALQFAREIQDVWGQDFAIQHGREGMVGERPTKEIGMHAVRVGDNVGEHTIVFSTLGETMELVHKGHSRDAYARGAIAAAKFLAGKGPGRYTMNDVLGL
jgi:4-hydroxy-tetrahydrodipicolinate reductase